MSNPFDELRIELGGKIDALIALISAPDAQDPERIPLADFLQQYSITRGTSYNWAHRGLIKMERIGNRTYVIRSSVKTVRKYEREPIAA